MKFGTARCSFCCLATEKQQDGHVLALALTGKYLYSASQGGAIRVRDHRNFSDCKYMGSKTGPARALAVDGDTVVSAHQDKKIRVWPSSRDGHGLHKRVATIPTIRDYLTNSIVSSNYVEIRRHHWSLWIKHVDSISALALGSDGLLYSGSWDRTIKVWMLTDFKCIETFKAHEDAVSAVVVGKQDRALYTASADGTVKVWARRPPMPKHVLIKTLKGNSSAVNTIALGQNDSVLYSGGSNGSIKVWRRKEYPEYMSFEESLSGHKQAVLCLITERELLFSSSTDKTIPVWKAEIDGSGHVCMAVLEGHYGPIRCLAVSKIDAMGEAFLLYSGSFDKSIKMWLLWMEQQEGDKARETDFLMGTEPSAVLVVNFQNWWNRSMYL